MSGRIPCTWEGIAATHSQPYAIYQWTSDSPKLDGRANIRVFMGLAMSLATAFCGDGGVS